MIHSRECDQGRRIAWHTLDGREDCRGIPSIEAMVNPESKDTFQFLGGGTAGNDKRIPPRSEGLCSQVSNRATPSAYAEDGACNPRK